MWIVEEEEEILYYIVGSTFHLRASRHPKSIVHQSLLARTQDWRSGKCIHDFMTRDDGICHFCSPVPPLELRIGEDFSRMAG